MRFPRSTTAMAAGVGLAVLVGGSTVLSASAAPAPTPTPATTTVTLWQPRTLTTTVYFANASSKLRSKNAAKLSRFAKRVPTDARKTRGTVIGTVQQGGSKALSLNRAKKVRSALVKRGLDGRWTTRGIGVAGPTKTSRKATVTLRFEAPRKVTVPLPPQPTATATVTATVTTTATVTATPTSTATPPVNLTLPVQTLDFVGDDTVFTHTMGEWTGATSYSAMWQRGDLVGEGLACDGWTDQPDWTTPAVVFISWNRVPGCLRVTVVASNGSASTTVTSEPFYKRLG